MAYDVVPCRWSAFVEAQDDRHDLVAQAIREGRLLYRDRELRRYEDAV